MTIDVHDRVRIAYKKLKQMVHFEKHPLTLRRRLAEFECAKDFHERLQLVAKVAKSEEPWATEEFKAWVADISFDVIPKGVIAAAKQNEEHGSYVSNVTSAPEHKVSKVNYMFDGPVEIHLLAVLWIMVEGAEYDKILSDHCAGSRLHPLVGDSNDNSALLFKKYHELYTNWRDSGIKKARELLSEDNESVCVVGLDVQEYYYRIQIDWKKLRNQVERPAPSGDIRDFFKERKFLGAKLFKCIEIVCKSYQETLNPLLETTHPKLPDGTTCLPIGLCTSPVIANWYLKDFDDAILEKVRPAYYGRYVDDILMVVAMPTPPDEEDPIMSFMDRVLVSAGVLRWDEEKASFELCSRPGLFLQRQKCVMQYFDAKHSTAGLEKFQMEIEKNASNFALLPVAGEDSPLAQVAYDLLYDGSVNKFRSVKAIAEDRWELAGHLAKLTQLHLMSEGSIEVDLKDELFRFFKGRNAINYWDMWERVISFLIVGGDSKAAESFQTAMLSENQKIRYENTQYEQSPADHARISRHLRESLAKHLELSMELSLAVTTAKGGVDGYEMRIWRKSNLIRHHLVAIPLLNYTNFAGNLAAPESPSGLSIDEQKAKNSPRYVHFDECLGFIDSGCIKFSKTDSIKRANEIFKMFHGYEQSDVTCEIIAEEEST